MSAPAPVAAPGLARGPRSIPPSPGLTPPWKHSCDPGLCPKIKAITYREEYGGAGGNIPVGQSASSAPAGEAKPRSEAERRGPGSLPTPIGPEPPRPLGVCPRAGPSARPLSYPPPLPLATKHGLRPGHLYSPAVTAPSALVALGAPVSPAVPIRPGDSLLRGAAHRPAPGGAPTGPLTQPALSPPALTAWPARVSFC